MGTTLRRRYPAARAAFCRLPFVEDGAVAFGGLLLILALLWAVPAHAQKSNSKILILNEQTRQISLTPYLVPITESGDWVDAARIVERELWKRSASQPAAAPKERLILPAGDNTLWFVMPVRNNTAQTRWYLNLGELADGRLGIVQSATVYVRTYNPYESLPGSNTPVIDPNAAPNTKMPALTGQTVGSGHLFPLSLPARENCLVIFKFSPHARVPAALAPSLLEETAAPPLVESRAQFTFIVFAALCAIATFFLAFSAATGLYGWLPFFFYFALQIVFGILQSETIFAGNWVVPQILSLTFPALGILAVFMTRTCLHAGHVNPRENSLYHTLFLLAGAGILISLVMPGEMSSFRTSLIVLSALIVFGAAGLYSILRYEAGQTCRLFVGIGWLTALGGAGLTILSLAGLIPAGSPVKNAYWLGLIPQGFCFIAAAILKNAGRVHTTQADGSTANLDIEALVKLRQTKETAEHARLLRVIEKERELLTQFRQREAQRTEEMQHAKEMADIANKAKSAFLAVVSHEIRTPMTGVMGMVRLLLETKLTKDQKDYVTTIQESGDSMLTLLNDILDFEKIEQGKMVLEDISFDLPRLVQSVATLMSGHAAIKNIHLKTIIDPDVPRYVMGDPSRLRQVLLNLTGNAIKFTSQGEVLLKIHLQKPDEDTLEERGGEAIYDVYFAVKDSGIGISPEAMENLFTPFAQADSSISRKFGGTGLGLAICKGLIERMNSKIHISSREGEGSMFFFTLPMRPGVTEDVDMPADTSGQNAPAAPRRQPMRSLHILVVDDNAVNQKVITSFLSRMNHTADTADTAESALAIIQKKIYDLILMDIQLPGMPGDEATRVLRKLPDPEKSNLPVIALTGNLRDEDKTTYRRAGMNGFVAKPIDPELLRETIETVMNDFGPKTQNAAVTDVTEDETDPGWPDIPETEHIAAPDDDVIVFDAPMLDTLKSNLGPEKLNDLLRELIDKTRELMEAMESAVARRDIATLKARAHELKGMTGNFGLSEISQIAARIEKAARIESANLFEEATPLVLGLPAALARAQNALAAWSRS